MKKTQNNAGFSLVELIVVIAIMAVLAGVGVVGYGIYTEEANKGVDRNLVSEIARALEHYSYVTSPTESATVFIDVEGATASNAFATEAMKAAFGDDWATVLKLSYDKWTQGAEGSAVANVSAAGLTSSVNVLTNLAATVVGSNDPNKATNIISGLFDEAMADEISAELRQYETDENYGTIASNLLVTYIANEVGNMTVQKNATSGELETSEVSDVSNLAVTYAMLYSMANSDDEYSSAAQEKLDDFNDALSEIAEREQSDSDTAVMAEIFSALSNMMSNSTVEAADGSTKSFAEVYDAYAAENAESDISGIVSAMKLVDSVSGDYTNAEDLSNPDLFKTEEVVHILEDFQNAINNKGIIVRINTMGTISVIPAITHSNV